MDSQTKYARGLKFLALATLALLLAALLVASFVPVAQADPNPNQAVHRPLADFLSQQGSTSQFLAPVGDYLGFSTTTSGIQMADPIRFASIDYAGLADRWLMDHGHPGVGTVVSGTILERPLADGRAEVQINLKTHNALAWGTVFTLNDVNADPLGVYQAQPLYFGNRPVDVQAGMPAALADSEFLVVFKNTAPGAALPDLVLAAFLGQAPPGFELIALGFHAKATGPLHAITGLGPDGTPGRLEVVQVATLARTPGGGATGDGWPVERVEWRRAGR